MPGSITFHVQPTSANMSPHTLPLRHKVQLLPSPDNAVMPSGVRNSAWLCLYLSSQKGSVHFLWSSPAQPQLCRFLSSFTQFWYSLSVTIKAPFENSYLYAAVLRLLERYYSLHLTRGNLLRYKNAADTSPTRHPTQALPK
jgi:hypothetical protein